MQSNRDPTEPLSKLEKFEAAEKRVARSVEWWIRLLLVGPLILGLGILSLYDQPSILFEAWTSSTWQSVPAKVVSSRMLKEGRRLRTFRPFVEYTYRMGDKGYVGHRVWAIEYLIDEREAQRVTDEFRPGQSVVALVNPDRPEQSVLRPVLPNYLYTMTALFVFFAGTYAVLMYLLLRKW